MKGYVTPASHAGRLNAGESRRRSTGKMPALLALLLIVPTALTQTETPYSFKAGVNVVVLNASVTDKRGRPISGLNRENFRVYEDGRPQELRFFHAEDVPATVGLIVDHSASMIPKRHEIIAAAMALADASNPRDEMFVVAFNEYASLTLPRGQPFAKNREELRAALNARRPAGKTAVYDAIALSLQHLEKGTTDKKVLVVISDGGDNASRQTLDQVLEMARRASAIIYTVGLFEPEDTEAKPAVLKRLSGATGGETFLPKSLNVINGICVRIARDIRTQYSLGYVPERSVREDLYRNVKVIAAGPDGHKLRVRTRSGYFAGSAPPTAAGQEKTP